VGSLHILSSRVTPENSTLRPGKRPGRNLKKRACRRGCRMGSELSGGDDRDSGMTRILCAALCLAALVIRDAPEVGHGFQPPEAGLVWPGPGKTADQSPPGRSRVSGAGRLAQVVGLRAGGSLVNPVAVAAGRWKNRRGRYRNQERPSVYSQENGTSASSLVPSG
jgi:hypothetical protein